MKIFGTTISETIDSFKPIHLGNSKTKKLKKFVALSRLVISILLLFVATFLFIKDNDSSKVGATIFGAVFGYWLK